MLLWSEYNVHRSTAHLEEECVIFHKRSGHRVPYPRTRVGVVVKPRLKHSITTPLRQSLRKMGTDNYSSIHPALLESVHELA